MSIHRLALSATGMAAIGALLGMLTPALPVMAGSLAHAQRTVDTAGPDALVLAAAGLLAWAVWVWGAVGLGLTALTAAPGALGAASSIALRLVLPAAGRRGATLLLGLGLGVAPLVGTVSVFGPPIASAAGPTSPAPAVPDWPAAAPAAPPAPPAPAGPSAPAAKAVPATAVPDWPTSPAVSGAAPTRSSDPHVVLRGECLWYIAAAHLAGGRPTPPTDGAIAAAVHAWWTANASVIGADPDRLLPGQLLVPPAGP